jgi:phosphate acetyltransferase
MITAHSSLVATHRSFFDHLVAAAEGKRVLLVESGDERVRAAARELHALGVVPTFLEHLGKGVGEDSTAVLTTAGNLLTGGLVDACVAGVVAPSPDVLRAALRTVGLAPGSDLVSAMYLMLFDDGRVLGYADCVVNPRPDPPALATIAIDSARTYRRLTGQRPRVAMLSFSTAGSSNHEDAALVREAVARVRTFDPDLLVDGELQLDAAVVPEVARVKAARSPLSGEANVLIFPNLDSGNIAYKLTERFAGAVAAGPVLQGLAKPYFDISRGSSVDDIVRQSLLAAAAIG